MLNTETISLILCGGRYLTDGRHGCAGDAFRLRVSLESASLPRALHIFVKTVSSGCVRDRSIMDGIAHSPSFSYNFERFQHTLLLLILEESRKEGLQILSQEYFQESFSLVSLS